MTEVSHDVTALDDKRRRVKEEYVAERGFWPAVHDALLELDPDFMRAYSQYVTAVQSKKALDPKTRQLIAIAIDAATTHLYNPGTLNNIRHARKLGATVEEILEVLEFVTLLGMHSTTEGAPLLLQVLREELEASPSISLADGIGRPETERLKEGNR